MAELHLDIETRSRVDLKRANVYRYVEDPDFRILMCAWSLDGSPVRVETEPAGIASIPGLWDDDVLKVAHNAAFERVCFSALALGRGREYLSPEQWHDTAAVAALRGYPRDLGRLAAQLGGAKKDEAGTRLINLFSKPNRAGGWNGPDTHPEEWAAFVRYCAQDVETLIDVDRRLGRFPTEAERRVYLVDQAINDRGVRVDRVLARAAVEAVGDLKLVGELEISRLTGVLNPASPVQMKRWLDAEGLALPDLRAATIERALAGQPMPAQRVAGKPAKVHPPVVLNARQRKALELRAETALAAFAKYDAAVAGVCEDGRLRGQFMYAGAHTGRWAGRGVQLHNMPRDTFTRTDEHGKKVYDEPAERAARLDVEAGFDVPALVLKALVRAMLDGPFSVVDYAAIEARVIAWLAGEQWALEAFARGRDIYVETAERMSTPSHPLTRAQGKVAVLALGYNGSLGSLRAMGADGTDNDLLRLVRQWRAANPSIVDLWAELGQAFRLGGRVGAGKVAVEVDGTDRLVRLPSGRAIEYHGVRHSWETTDSGDRRLVAKFRDPQKGVPVRTYGGKLTENVTQAVARDLLAEALVRLHDAGYRVVGHVHDEVIVEGDDVEGVRELVTQTPSWAAGLPVDGEGFYCTRYRKG